MQDEHFWACVRRIGSILGGLAIPYHFTGGLASSFYGEPRFTQDVDVVIRLSVDESSDRAHCWSALSTGYFINRQAIRRRDPAERHLPGYWRKRPGSEDRLSCR